MERNRFATFAWAVLGYNLLVILWGAFVRATGSGAGCGSHWPLCNGEVLPRPERIETLIELTHRATSGLALIAVVVLLVWAVRRYPRGHHVRLGATLSMGFILLEALLGAGLVLFELVADNDSMVRALSMVAHLVNTFVLVGCLTLTAWWGSGGPPVRLRGQGKGALLLAAALGGVLLVGASGAVAALGDTLFPARSLSEGLRADLAPAAHLLLRLRVFHPVIAIGVGLFILVAVRLIRKLRPAVDLGAAGAAVASLVIVQLVLGALNVTLLAPVWMQLVHLLFADLLWIALVVFAARALAAPGGALPAWQGLTARRSDVILEVR